MDKIEELLTRGVENIYPSEEILRKDLESGKKLKLYQGFDPTGIKLHIGHIVGLKKLRQWQDLGHEVIFLIGDGTGQAGDPSGKTRSREKYLTNEELKSNAKDYVMQAGRIVRFDGDNPVKILYNGDWLNKLTLVDVLNIADNFTLQQLEERDLYAKRKQAGEFINMREFFYPMLQAYDSVAMEVDLELGGDDQTFNMLCGRNLAKKMLGKEKYVMTTPLLTDSQGKKIGKTEGNVIALDSEPSDFYGMIMSLSDDVIVKCFEYITDVEMPRIDEIKKAIESGENPMIFKKELAYELTKMLNSEEHAKKAAENFESVFSRKELPSEIKEMKVESGDLLSVLIETGLASSKSSARRLIEQGAVKIDSDIATDPSFVVDKREYVLSVGKRNFVKVKHNA